MLFFIHIPKAAGTSLRMALEKTLQDRLVVIYEDHPGETTADALARDLPEDAVVYGHFGFGLHEKFGAAANYATVLRHPVARVTSWYNFQAQDPNLPYSAAARKFSLPELLRQESTEEISNHMTKIIAGRDVRNLNDRGTLEMAKANLRTFDFISVQERLSEDMEKLRGLLNVSLIRPKKINVGRSRQPTQGELEDVVKYNMLDLELYYYAMDLREEMAVPE